MLWKCACMFCKFDPSFQSKIQIIRNKEREMGRLYANGCVVIKLMCSRSRWQWQVIGSTIVTIDHAEQSAQYYPEHVDTCLSVIVFY